MTSTLIAMLVDQRYFDWDTTIVQVFPEWAEEMQPAYRDVTLSHLLTHYAGLPSNIPAKLNWPAGMSFRDTHGLPGSPTEQRQAYSRLMLQTPPSQPPGTAYQYSNVGYAIAGAMAERVTHTSWEKLMTTWLFEPLRIETAGFGPMGSPDTVEAPWPHQRKNGHSVAIRPDRFSDNPPAIGPAGTVHMSIGDWAKFVNAHLQGAQGKPTPLRLSKFDVLHTPVFGGTYAPGWQVTQRRWGGGTVLTHTGTNTLNYAAVWMAPRRDFAVLVTTNQGGGNTAKAVNDITWQLIQWFLSR